MEAAKLKALLECPVCLLLPRSNIFNCINSHRICELCYNMMAKDMGGMVPCPQGGCGYDKPPRRARDLEALVENSDLEFGCKILGCKVEMKKNKILVHEVSCIFRAVPCPQTACQQKVLFKNIDSHVEKNHKEKEVRSVYRPYLEEKILDALNWNWGLDVFLQNGVKFYPQFVKRFGFWYFWIRIKESSTEAAKWKFLVKLSVENQFSVEFAGSVHPVDLTVDEILETGQYLLLDRQMVDKLKGTLLSKVTAGYSSILYIPFKVFKI